MKEACKNIGRKVKDTNRMTSNEFFAFSLLFVSVFSVLIGFVVDLLGILP
jgi:hypothetical protein